MLIVLRSNLGLNHFLIEYYATSFSRLDERYIYGADIWLENIGRDNRAMLKHVEIKHDADQLGPYLLGGAMGHYRAQTAFEFEALGIVMDEKVRHIVRGHKDRADSWMPFDLNATGKDIRLVLSAEKQARQPGSLAYRGIYAGEYFEEDDEDEEDHEDDEAEEVADEDAEDEV